MTDDTPREHTPWAEAARSIRPGHAVVLWRPGCPWCSDLLRALLPDRRVTWVNVWSDPDAAAQVRALNGGDEYVPTAIVGDVVLRNPSVGDLTAALDRG